MNIDFDISKRLSQLQTEICDRPTFLSIYGIDLWTMDSEAAALFKVWAAYLGHSPEIIQSERINRWLFERFLQQEHYLPTKIAAIRFAMLESDFTKLIDKMCEKGMLPYSTTKTKDLGLYSTSFLDNLTGHFSLMKFRSFNSQTAFINLLHEVIRKELNIEITTVYSECSRKLNENPLEVAYEYDVITGEPMGIAHQVWLDFKKPLSLKPDACSELTFKEYWNELREWSFSQPAETEA